MTSKQERRIGELEDELKAANKRIIELKRDIDEQSTLITKMSEHLAEARDDLIEGWINAFDMVLNDKGDYCWQDGLIQDRDKWFGMYMDLRKKWNTFVGEYNSVVRPRNFGRPLAASDSQRADVLKRRKAGQSLRDIAEDTNLGLRTVRTIVDRPNWVDRATMARLQRIAPDRVAEIRARASKRDRDALPARINETLKLGAELLKEAKGLRK